MDVLAELEDLKHLIRARVPLHIQDRLGFHRRKRRLESRVKADPDIIMITTGNDRRTEGHDWYRGEQINFMPSRTNLFEKNAIEDYVLKGWLPDKPFISKSDCITAFGSCFAEHVTDFANSISQGLHHAARATEHPSLGENSLRASEL